MVKIIHTYNVSIDVNVNVKGRTQGYNFNHIWLKSYTHTTSVPMSISMSRVERRVILLTIYGQKIIYTHNVSINVNDKTNFLTI